MSNSTEIELNDSAKELIRVCSEIEGTLKSLGYTKVDSEPGIGEYMSDLHGTEEPSFSFCTKGKSPFGLIAIKIWKSLSLSMR